MREFNYDGVNPAYRPKNKNNSPRPAMLAPPAAAAATSDDEDAVITPAAPSASTLTAYTQAGPAPGVALPAAQAGDANLSEWVVYTKAVPRSKVGQFYRVLQTFTQVGVSEDVEGAIEWVPVPVRSGVELGLHRQVPRVCVPLVYKLLHESTLGDAAVTPFTPCVNSQDDTQTPLQVAVCTSLTLCTHTHISVQIRRDALNNFEATVNAQVFGIRPRELAPELVALLKKHNAPEACHNYCLTSSLLSVSELKEVLACGIGPAELHLPPLAWASIKRDLGLVNVVH